MSKMYNVLSILCIFILFSVNQTEADLKEIGSLLWKKAWKISCQFSTTTSRSKRSIVGFPEDLNNSEELFQYLYPSLDLKPKDFINNNNGGGRSASAGSFLSNTWIEDIIDYWNNECHDLQKKTGEDGNKKNVSNPRNDDETEKSTISFRNSTLLPGSTNNSAVLLTMTATDSKKLKTSSKNANGSGKESITGKQLATQQAASQNQLVRWRQPLYFSSYGGDIEYFYPVYGMGIPFDGEITFLGFHGFKGLFPYR